MCRYGLSTNYLQLKEKDCNKGEMLYIDGRKKIIGNIVGFINSTQPWSKIKQPKCIFEGCEENHVFVYAIKSIAVGEELPINYKLN